MLSLLSQRERVTHLNGCILFTHHERTATLLFPGSFSLLNNEISLFMHTTLRYIVIIPADLEDGDRQYSYRRESSRPM